MIFRIQKPKLTGIEYTCTEWKSFINIKTKNNIPESGEFNETEYCHDFTRAGSYS